MSQKRIKKLETRNLKGADQEVNFTPKTIICGDNGSGKSSILDGIKLALLGEHDQLGKQGKKLMAFSADNKKTEVSLEFEDGDECLFSLEPRGKTGKVSHIGIPVDPSLRLNLCPDEFWGKGDTARMETLLQMCGDSSLVTKEFISNCISRVRVAGLNKEDREEVKRLAELAESIIQDGDIATLAELEKHLSAERTESSRALKHSKAVVEGMVSPEKVVTEEESYDVHFKLEGLLSRSEKIGKDWAREERAMEKRDKLLEKKALADSRVSASGMVKSMQEEHEALSDEIAKADESIYQLTNFNSPTMTKLTDRAPVTGIGDLHRVEGNGLWTGSTFAMINDTVSWSEDGLLDGEGNKPEDKKEELDEAVALHNRLTAEKHELGKKIAEELGIEKLTDAEKLFLEKHIDVDYKARIHALNSELAGFSDKLNLLRDRMNEIAGARSQQKLKEDLEVKLSRAERSYNTIKSVLKTVRDLQKDIISSAVNDAMVVVNAVTRGIVSSPIEWDGNKMGRRLKNGSWVSIDTFSGAEKAVTQMGLGVALASRSNFRLAVLDEVSRLDNANQSKLFANLNTLIDDGKLDQYIAFCINLPSEGGDHGDDVVKVEDTIRVEVKEMA